MENCKDIESTQADSVSLNVHSVQSLQRTAFCMCLQVTRKALRVIISLGVKIAAFISVADIINFPFPSAATLADYPQWHHKVILLLCVSPCQISLLLILGGFHQTNIFHTGDGCVSAKAHMRASCHLLSLTLCLNPRLTISQLYPDYS